MASHDDADMYVSMIEKKPGGIKIEKNNIVLGIAMFDIVIHYENLSNHLRV